MSASFPWGLDRLRQRLKSDVAQMSKILYSFENWSCEDSWKLLLVVRTCKDVVAVDVLTVDLVAASFLMGMGTMMLCLMVPPVQDEFSISDRKPLNELEEIGSLLSFRGLMGGMPASASRPPGRWQGKRLQKACSGNAPASGRHPSTRDGPRLSEDLQPRKAGWSKTC